jgi:hypothetical protein
MSLEHQNEIINIMKYFITEGKNENLEKLMPVVTKDMVTILYFDILKQKQNQVNIIKILHKHKKIDIDNFECWACNNDNSITVETFELFMELGIKRYNDIYNIFELCVKYNKIDMIKSLKNKILKEQFPKNFYHTCAKYGNVEAIKLLKDMGIPCENNDIIERLIRFDEIKEIPTEILDQFKEGLSINYWEIFAHVVMYPSINSIKKLIALGVVDKFMAEYALNLLFVSHSVNVNDNYLEIIDLLRKQGASEISHIHVKLRESKSNEKVYNYMTEWAKESANIKKITTANEFKANIKDYAKQLMTTYMKEEMSKPNPNIEEICAIIKTNENYN